MQQQESLGDQVRNIAKQLQKEKNLQIKSTSQILGAAAQISKNHDQLIDEVVQMAEEDLIQQSQSNTYNVEILKKKFGTLGEAKAHFELKANSWKNLAKKLNFLSIHSTLATDNADPSILKRLNSIEGEIKAMHVEISQILAILMQNHNQ
jgi:hypothetical protein